jgi:hypothetical protein
MALTDQKAAYMGSSLTTKASDSLGKRKVLQKLELTLGKHDCIVSVIRDILERNFIRVSDGLMLFDTIWGTARGSVEPPTIQFNDGKHEENCQLPEHGTTDVR